MEATLTTTKDKATHEAHARPKTTNKSFPKLTRRSSSVRYDSIGSSGHHHHGHVKNVDSLTYIADESAVYNAAVSSSHYVSHANFTRVLLQNLLISVFFQ